MFLRRLFPAIPLLFVFAVCSAGAQQTSFGNGTSSATSADPYAPRSSSGYTSSDNPYATGGLYDPYRTQQSATPPSSANAAAARKKHLLGKAMVQGRTDIDSRGAASNGFGSCGKTPSTYGSTSFGSASPGLSGGPVSRLGLAASRCDSNGTDLRGSTLAKGQLTSPNGSGQAEAFQNRRLQRLQKLPQ